MNTNGLAKLYEHLEPKERLPLILAASARGDEEERDRLTRSAPRKGFSVPDYHGLGGGLFAASLLQLLQILDAAVMYWQTSGLLGEWDATTDGGKDGPPERLRKTVPICAYQFVTKLDGWRHFCSEFKCDPEILMDGLPGYDMAKQTEEAAKLVACTKEEATAWMRKVRDEPFETLTAENVAASLWAFVNKEAARWE